LSPLPIAFDLQQDIGGEYTGGTTDQRHRHR
jgi:hypothetical protein